MLRHIAAVLVVLASLCAGIRAERPLWLAVGPPELLQAIEPLAAHRRAEGMETILSSGSPEQAVAGAPRLPDFLLLVGDDAPGASSQPWYVPSARRPFHGWGAVHRPDFASDFAWGGFDDRGVPQIPTGRLPVRSAPEAAALAEKILAWEKQPATSLSLPMWAGDPLYAPEYTERFMNFLFSQVQRNAPAWLEPWVLSGDAKHSLAGPFTQQVRLFNERTARGAIFTGMIGHGLPDHFLSLRLGRNRIGYGVKDARLLTEGAPRPPHVIFACQAGKFTLPNDRCLAEELVLAPAGPVLCIAATEDSHPLPNFYTATSLLQKVKATEGTARFGTLWLEAQRAARRRHDALYELLLRDAEGRLNKGRADVELLKIDQAALYAIMGDPATTVHIPQKLEAKMTKTEHGWQWEVIPPPGATQLRVEQRTESPDFPGRPADADEAKLTGLFETAAALLAFRPVVTLPSGQPWRGETTGTGVLRLVAETATGLYVAGFDLR
jgi:hypothetical protein